MTNGRDTEKLAAWLDGEADETATSAMHRRLSEDAELARAAAEYGEIDALLRHHWNGELDAPVPLALARTVRQGFARRRRGDRLARLAMVAAPVAASIAIVAVGLLWAERHAGEKWRDRQMEIASLVDSAVQDALETAVSGTTVSHGGGSEPVSVSVTPVRTYRSQSQHWCREFEETVIVDGETVHRTGLACRESGGGWTRVETRAQGETMPPI